jgi:hypothetical protein
MATYSVTSVGELAVLIGPFTAGDIAVVAGYHESGDGGGGLFAFDDRHAISVAINDGPRVLFTCVGHGLTSGQSIQIAQPGIPGAPRLFEAITVTGVDSFSVSSAELAGSFLNGVLVDGGMCITTSIAGARWVRVEKILDPRFYGAKCDGVADDSVAMQNMVDFNPGGHYRLPGSTGAPVVINMYMTSLRLKGRGWILEGGGNGVLNEAFKGGGTTLRWGDRTKGIGTTGIIVEGMHGPGTIRHLNLVGGEPFAGAESSLTDQAVWNDAILPDFNDLTGFNVLAREIKSVSWDGVSVGVLVSGRTSGEFGHSYVVGTQVKLDDVLNKASVSLGIEGIFYISNIGRRAAGGGDIDYFEFIPRTVPNQRWDRCRFKLFEVGRYRYLVIWTVRYLCN